MRNIRCWHSFFIGFYPMMMLIAQFSVSHVIVEKHMTHEMCDGTSDIMFVHKLHLYKYPPKLNSNNACIWSVRMYVCCKLIERSYELFVRGRKCVWFVCDSNEDAINGVMASAYCLSIKYSISYQIIIPNIHMLYERCERVKPNGHFIVYVYVV